MSDRQINLSEISKTDLTDFLRNYSLEGEFNSLPESLQHKIKSGVETLVKIDRTGRAIEESDRKILIGDKDISELEPNSFERQVDEELKQVDRVYHGSEGRDYDWLYRSTKDLLNLAKHTNYETRSGARNYTFSGVDSYRKRLLEAGSSYQIYLGGDSGVEEARGEDIRKYIDGERYGQLQTIATLEGVELEPLISGLRPED